MIKKFFLFSVFIVTLFACKKENLQDNNLMSSRDNFVYKYSITAIDSLTGEIVPKISVMAITDKEDIIGECNESGVAVFQTNEPVRSVICASLGKCGFVVLNSNIPNVRVMINNFKITRINQSTKGTYGVYSTDGNGDVSFRYQGNFQSYYCTSLMPSYLPGVNPVWQSTNPNTWNGWDLTNWLPTWKGKKLLVPSRCQWFHQQTYGYSISQALFLTTN